MHLEHLPLLRCVVAVEPPEDMDVREALQTQQSGLVILIENDQGAVFRLPDVSDRLHGKILLFDCAGFIGEARR